MALSKHYNPAEAELRLQIQWQAQGIFHFSADSQAPVFSIDTPPPTVSGHLHLGHVYSYSHPDFIARFWRMRGRNIFYPMGYDDNGLPTERLVEKRLGITAAQVGRPAFIEKCLQVSEGAEQDYQALWQRLGLSIDWRYTYRTIDDRSRRTSQFSFIDLVRKGLAYRREAPAIWCPECRTALAQADLNDLERSSEFITLPFSLDGEQAGKQTGKTFIPVATTRPELLPACVAVFVHPGDSRYRGLAGGKALVPIFGQSVPILEDSNVDPEKGSGAVMCCTFGDPLDVSWWLAYRLPLIEALDREGKMTRAAREYAGLTATEARRQIKQTLESSGLVLERQPLLQTVRVHERCDTPVEYIVAQQWFVRILDSKQDLIAAGEKVKWHPPHMLARYRSWVENLGWDWCISRQRYFGVPFPVWYCQECREVVLAGEDQLPVDPTAHTPPGPCNCGSTSFIPETDVMDTWATSSLSPQIVGRWLEDPGSGENGLYARVFPFTLRPQAHEIIRTWAFYTILKSQVHFSRLPWENVLISGWGIAGEGMGKISKSRGGGPVAPLEMIERYSADAVRYWAASTSPGKDAVISEEKIQTGARLVTKLWNVARFCERFLADNQPPPIQVQEDAQTEEPQMDMLLTPADRWILSRLQRLIRRVTALYENYDYAAAKSEVEAFFWTEVADNYLEMCKQRLYDASNPTQAGARFSLYQLLLTLLKLFAPILPHVTEEIYQKLFAGCEPLAAAGVSQVPPENNLLRQPPSIHISTWPDPQAVLEDDRAEQTGEILVEIATAVRRYKSEASLPLNSEVDRLQLTCAEPGLAQSLSAARMDLMSVTRARQVEILDGEAPLPGSLLLAGNVRAGIIP